MDERLADLRARSILVNWNWWPMDLTGNLDYDRRKLVRSAFQRRSNMQEENFASFEQAMIGAPPKSGADRVEKLLKELVAEEGKAEQALVDELDEILLPDQLTEFVKGYMKRPSVSLLVSPLGKLYLDLSDAQFSAISELHEKQANLLRLSNVAMDEQQVKYAKKQVPLLGVQIGAVLTEAQIKKHWDLLPGADRRLSFEQALAKKTERWQRLQSIDAWPPFPPQSYRRYSRHDAGSNDARLSFPQLPYGSNRDQCPCYLLPFGKIKKPAWKRLQTGSIVSLPTV